MATRNELRIVTAALAVVLLSSPWALAQGGKQSGTVIAVAEEVVKVKGTDGKTYEVKVADVIGENLKTGDIVEYEIVEEKPVKAHKKK